MSTSIAFLSSSGVWLPDPVATWPVGKRTRSET
jgi:hypothetical protein